MRQIILGFALLSFGCTASKPAPPPAASNSQATPQLLVSQQLWGEMKPVVSVKELMRNMLDPASDYIFDGVKEVTTSKGTIKIEPKTDEDWDKIRTGATTIAEGVYLLKVPRPFAPPGDENNSKGPEASELSPAQILAKLQKDPVLWNAKIEALRNVGLEVLDIVKKKNTQEMWEASYNLDQACENCHLQYWYPGDPALLKRIDKELEKKFGVPVPEPKP